MRHLSPDRYTAETFLNQHAGANEPPQSTQSVPQPAPELPSSGHAVPVIQSAASLAADPAEKPYLDPAEPILAGDPRLTDETRADLWSIFHESRDASELTAKLSTIEVPNDLKHALWTAKSVTSPVSGNADKITAALTTLSKMDPKLLEIAETHKQVTKMVIDAALKSYEE